MPRGRWTLSVCRVALTISADYELRTSRILLQIDPPTPRTNLKANKQVADLEFHTRLSLASLQAGSPRPISRL